MPDLIHSLLNRDLGHLRIVAELWGVEIKSPETDAALKELSAALLDRELVREITGSLSLGAKSALNALTQAGGKIPWAAFARQFGELREAGPGRRDRERIYLNPISAAETLFYHALLARAFFDTPNGPQEFAYLPDDLFQIINNEKSLTPSPLPTGAGQGVRGAPFGRLATPKERAHIITSSDRILDDATTLLAALRMNVNPSETTVPANVVTEFLSAAKIILPSPDRSPKGMLREGVGGSPTQWGEVQTEPVRIFLESSRKGALETLTAAWHDSTTFNELRLIPSLVCDGEWANSPLVTRHLLLSFLNAIPKNQWWSLPAFVQDIKQKHPDYQRPAGDYDSWFIKRVSDGVYLRGFASWDEVDGTLVRYLITGPLHWLGLVELASADGSDSVTAFRVNEKQVTSNENSKLTVSSNGRITVPRLVPRVTRYLISRFCIWDEAKPDEYRYHVTTASLKKAAEQGLKVNQLLSLLAKNAAAEIPPAFVKSLKRWELNGTEARVEVQTVLRVGRPEVLEELRKSKAGRFLGESLGPVTVVVKPGAQSKVLAALAELGLLAEDVTKVEPEEI
jgi:hypothetical protein